jgi:beta-aspartyl-peptidase (threonine type)
MLFSFRRQQISLSVVFLGLLGSTAALTMSPDARPEEDTAASKEVVRRLLDDQVVAWNKGDLKGFMKTYWNSRDLTFFSGKDVTAGWEATLARYEKRYRSEGKEMGQLSFKDVEVEVASPTLAWVRGRWQLVNSKETLGGLFTLIVRKLPEGWRIVHDHTSG